MVTNIGKLDTQRALKLFGEWTDRIAAGELPTAQPPRPQGVERNVVVTLWDWATPKAYLHDEISTDRRNPTVNAHGLIYGSPELSTDFVPIVDPMKNAKSQVKLPVRDPNTPNTADDPILAPSPYWGTEAIWNGQANIHNPMFDATGRVWFTARIRPADDPAFCKAGSDQPSARLFPLQRSGRQAAMYDPRNREVHADRPVLHDPSSAVRPRCQRHAVVQQRWRQRRRRLAQYQNVRRHRRRAEVAGLDRLRPRHKRQRQARRLCRAQPAGRSEQGQAHHGRPVRDRPQPARWVDLGFGAGVSRRGRAGDSGGKSAGDRIDRDL